MFLQFIGIWLLITENPVTNRTDYFRENSYRYFWWVLNSFQPMYTCQSFEIIFSALKLDDPPPPLLLPFKIKFMMFYRWLSGEMVTWKHSSYRLGYRVYINLYPYGWINIYAQAFSYALTSPIQRVMSITSPVVVKVVSYTAGMFCQGKGSSDSNGETWIWDKSSYEDGSTHDFKNWNGMEH